MAVVLRRCCLAWALLAAAACDSVLSPDQLTSPQLRTLTVDDFSSRLAAHGVVYIRGYPADTSFRLERNQRVPVSIAVSSGDREEFGLYRYLCPARERDAHYVCHDFLIVMSQNQNVNSLTGLLESHGATLLSSSLSGSSATAGLFSAAQLIETARDARGWPGVAGTELTTPFCAPGPGCVSLSELALPVPVDTGTARNADGVVQLRSADTVTISFTQPQGGVIQVQRIVP